MKLTVVTPVYNEVNGIEKIVARVQAVGIDNELLTSRLIMIRLATVFGLFSGLPLIGLGSLAI